MIYPVILSGGSGTRLWPMSRTLYPKQLLSLLGRDSLLQQTVRRVADRQGFASPLLVANEEHRFIIAEQLREWRPFRARSCSSRSAATQPPRRALPHWR